jgi:hypothetical protein
LGGERPIKWIVGSRGRRSIGLEANGVALASNLFNLSTGQTALLDIFLTVMRDYDASGQPFHSLDSVKGVVVIDEVDMHLHAELQHELLPNLIKLFPQVQFIITTHSPLFILGLERALGVDGFELIELPSGIKIGVERFSEFEEAYRYFTHSAKFESDIRRSIEENQKPIIFAEGSIDIDLLVRAAELLGRKAALESYRLVDANGFGGLDKLWKHFDKQIAQLTSRRVTLLYDCDVQRETEAKPGIRRITIPRQPNRIEKGIENLFPDALLMKARDANAAYIDVTRPVERLVRGVLQVEPERWEVNPDEKRNLANWVIANATVEEMSPFSVVFDLLDNFQGGQDQR